MSSSSLTAQKLKSLLRKADLLYMRLLCDLINLSNRLSCNATELPYTKLMEPKEEVVDCQFFPRNAYTKHFN